MYGAIDLALQDELLQQARAGDYDAFEQLYRWLEPGLARFVRRLIGDGAESEDVLQDTFLALYMNLDRIQPTANLRPYAYRIARNNCFDRLRSWGRYDEVSIDDDNDDAYSPRLPLQLKDEDAQPPDEVTHWLLLGLEVRQAIDRLPEAQRQTLILYCEEELTYAEIAEVMDVSIGTVKSRLFHAKKTLRGLVRPEILLAVQDGAPQRLENVREHQTPSNYAEGVESDGRNNAGETQPISTSLAGAASFG